MRKMLETDPREASVQLIIVKNEIYPALITGIGTRLRLIKYRVQCVYIVFYPFETSLKGRIVINAKSDRMIHGTEKIPGP